MRIGLSQLQSMHAAGEKIAMICCYDSAMAILAEDAGAEIILVGDSLGMLVQGHDSTLPVSLDHAIYHTTCVARGTKKAVVLGDLPFGSYQVSPEQAFESGARLMAAGATMVKLEGGAAMAPAVEFMASRGIPVCGHLGLTPQSVFTLGGFKVQGKTEDAAKRVIEDAKALERAGACMIVLEAVPSEVGRQMQEALSIPVIGIGAGPQVAGQILLMYDMLDIYRGRKAKFVKNFMAGAPSIFAALETYVKEVKSGAFPSPEYCY